MDPVTHFWITRKLVGKEWKFIVLGLAPDLPFYLFYPYQVVSGRKLREGFQHDEWPKPPVWLYTTHNIFHSLPLATSLLLLQKIALKRGARLGFMAWILHILIDIPTHSRQKWAPQFLWPFSRFTVDGISWTDYFFPLLWKIYRRIRS